MSKVKYLQPAFPTYEQNGNLSLELSREGMTLLDYVAAKALPYFQANNNSMEKAAHYAYMQAEVMLEERKNYIH
jgi:hypothetical protein